LVCLAARHVGVRMAGLRVGTDGAGRGDGCTAVFTARRNRAQHACGDTAGRRTTLRLWLDHRRCDRGNAGADCLCRAGRGDLERASAANLARGFAHDRGSGRPRSCRSRRRAVARIAAPWPAADRKTCGAPAASRGYDHRRGRRRAGRDPSFAGAYWIFRSVAFCRMGRRRRRSLDRLSADRATRRFRNGDCHREPDLRGAQCRLIHPERARRAGSRLCGTHADVRCRGGIRAGRLAAEAGAGYRGRRAGLGDLAGGRRPARAGPRARRPYHGVCRRSAVNRPCSRNHDSASANASCGGRQR